MCFAWLGATPLPLGLATAKLVLLAATPQALEQLSVTHVQQAATSQVLGLQPRVLCALLGATPLPRGLSTALCALLAATSQALEQQPAKHVQQAAILLVLGHPLQPAARSAWLGATPPPLGLASAFLVLLAATSLVSGQLPVNCAVQVPTSQAQVWLLQQAVHSAWLGATPLPLGLSSALCALLVASSPALGHLPVICVRWAATLQVLG